MYTIGGSLMSPGAARLAGADRGFPHATAHLGMRAPFVKARVSGRLDGSSEEDMLPANNARGETLERGNTTHAKDDFIVESVRKPESSRSA